MNKIIVNVGDDVTLFNHTRGVIERIDKSNYQFVLCGGIIIWFHIRDIKKINGELIDNDLLIF